MRLGPTVTLLSKLSCACVMALAVGSCDDDADGIFGPPALGVAGQHRVEVGSTLSLTASNADGAKKDTAFDWTSDDSTIASVDPNGTVTGVAAGETEVVVTGKQTQQIGRHVIVVTDKPVEPGDAVVTLGTQDNQVVLLVNETLTLVPGTINGQDAGYGYSSSNDDIATVASNGTVTGVAPGSVTITAEGGDTGATATITLSVTTTVPAFADWNGSGHSDRKAEAFRHWDEDGEVPTSCARCHSSGGFEDYIGADGSAVGSVDKAAATNTVIGCDTCHSPAASELDFATFPSGVTLTGLGAEARCMTCHQGRSSTDNVDSAVVTAAELDVSDLEADETKSDEEKRQEIRARIQDNVALDEVPAPASDDDKLGFLNIHYYAAGATLNAGRVRGGYQYPNKVYDWRFRHVPSNDTCVECHDPHSLQVKIDDCKTCHTDVTTVADLGKIRMIDSKATDFDGDGDLEEGIADEIEGLQVKLMQALQAYSNDKEALAAICYGAASYPYFFKDTDGSGDCSAAEAVFPNRITDWTPRLLRAAYNYQVSAKDPGAFAHNAKYIIQLLHDSISDLNGAIAVEANRVDMANAERDDPAHFNGASEAARHWDEDEEVRADCSACHGGAEGLRFFLTHGVGAAVSEPDNGLDCATCHDNVGRANKEGESPWRLVAVDSVELPSSAKVPSAAVPIAGPETGANPNLICGTCHKGRSAMKAIDAAIASAKASGEPSRFVNVHYRAAFSTALGADGKLGYEYPEQAGKYSGRKVWPAVHGSFNECVECHSPKNTNHSFDVNDNLAACSGCHGGITSASEIVMLASHKVDVDGDGLSPAGTGATFETLHDEIEGLAALLLKTMNAALPLKKICYENSYPYFKVDNNSTDGNCVPNPLGLDSYAFDMTDPVQEKLLKAAHNYQIWHTEPGAWAHNFDYIWQLLYFSIVDLDPAAVAGLPVPPAPGT